ncbi:inosine/guanosine kinase [Piscirickettsia litoralis]|uniref:Guanosine-inosine kinase n=1 Tax=Piscirickettsia litoralis TaxID=1891921 RepID=A0ABX3A2X8_9GAMM|nr:inosine/guanosine kinase [Piscirickettsia litoralis]ODN42592.1 inosine/guanosine kinase [Piscirickettsia litoralis]
MRFPGKRKIKHYFPISSRGKTHIENHSFSKRGNTYITGVTQVLVDIEAHVDESLLAEYGLKKGESLLIGDQTADNLYSYLKNNDLIISEYAGGTIGNSLHNYSVLADDVSVQLGVMSENIGMQDSAYRYLCNTSSRVDLTHLQPVSGPIGRCITLITSDGERSFGINSGVMNQLSADYVKEETIKDTVLLGISSYILRDESLPMFEATLKAVKLAKKHNVPVVLTLGTQFLINEKQQFFYDFINEYVSIIAMNEDEGYALTGHKDPLLASQAVLDIADLVLTTVGPQGLYLSGYTDKTKARQTSNPLLSGAISDFNQYEFSRPMRKSDCQEPLQVFAHINPYMGGPEKIQNTNGAGDGALAALFHDMAANHYHRTVLPNSSKHDRAYLTYSSFAQVCKYANRVSYEVLAQNATRLSRGLPDREDSLEDGYWER